jgi:K(+)-stimulated pyrophosphate-energized sodium pump
MSFAALIPTVLGILGLFAAYFVFRTVKAYPGGSGKVADIGKEIHDGAMVFMHREYKILGIFVVVVLALLLISPLSWHTSLAFIVGALASASAGYIGMYTATQANVRTTTAAHEKGAPEALTVAFFGGSIMGLAVASTGLLGLGFLYLLFGSDPATADTIHGFGMGASSVALFPVSAAAFSPRAPMSVPTWWAKSRQEFPRTIRAIRA